VLALALGLATGCGSCSKSSDATAPEASAAVIAPEPPVPAPERLLAEMVVATPDATWKRVQQGVGGAAGILPNSFAGVVCALAGLDPPVANEVDGAAPAYAAIGEGQGDAIAFAIAMKLADAARTQTTLFDAENARFNAKDAGGMRVVVGKSLPLRLTVAIARSGWLVVASSEADLARLAPYAYRTLPTRPAQASAVAIDVPRSALAGAVRARAAASWGGTKAWLLARDADERKKHGGRAADFGDPPAIVACVDAAIERRLAIVGDLAGAHVDFDASEDDVHLVATLKAGGDAATKRFDAMKPGAAAPLLEAPADAAVAWIVRDDAAERASDAHDIEQCVESALGKRIGDDDKKRLAALADEWAKLRGDWLLGTAMSSASRGLVVRGPSPDADAAARAVRDATQLFQRPFLADPLKRLLRVREIAPSKVDAPPLGKVDVVTLVRDEPKAEKDKPKLPSAPLGLAWLAGNGELSLALGESPAALLATATKPKAKLGDDARAARAIGAIETNAIFAIVAQYGAKGAGPPAVFAWGRRERDGWARLEVGYGVLREILRSFIAP